MDLDLLFLALRTQWLTSPSWLLIPKPVCQNRCRQKATFDDSPSFQFTICSSITAEAVITTIPFFQLLRQSGNPWISLYLIPGGYIFKLTVMLLLWYLISDDLFLGRYTSFYFNNQPNPGPTNDLGSQLCGHRLCPQPLDSCGEREEAGRQSLSNSCRRATSFQLDWEVVDLQRLPGLLVPVQEQGVQSEHLFEAADTL